jgi:hypothetical protein
MQARELLESISLLSGTVIVALLSAFAAIVFAFLERPVLRRFAAYGAPLIFAYVLYWMPVWLGANPSEYKAWSLVCIIPWASAGAFAAGLVLAAARRL